MPSIGSLRIIVTLKSGSLKWAFTCNMWIFTQALLATPQRRSLDSTLTKIAIPSQNNTSAPSPTSRTSKVFTPPPTLINATSRRTHLTSSTTKPISKETLSTLSSRTLSTSTESLQETLLNVGVPTATQTRNLHSKATSLASSKKKHRMKPKRKKCMQFKNNSTSNNTSTNNFANNNVSSTNSSVKSAPPSATSTTTLTNMELESLSKGFWTIPHTLFIVIPGVLITVVLAIIIRMKTKSTDLAISKPRI